MLNEREFSLSRGHSGLWPDDVAALLHSGNLVYYFIYTQYTHIFIHSLRTCVRTQKWFLLPIKQSLFGFFWVFFFRFFAFFAAYRLKSMAPPPTEGNPRPTLRSIIRANPVVFRRLLWFTVLMIALPISAFYLARSECKYPRKPPCQLWCLFICLPPPSPPTCCFALSAGFLASSRTDRNTLGCVTRFRVLFACTVSLSRICSCCATVP